MRVGTEQESEDEEVDIVDSLVLSNRFERVERWGEDVRYTYPSFQCVLYIVQVHENFIDYLEVIYEILIDLDDIKDTLERGISITSILSPPFDPFKTIGKY